VCQLTGPEGERKTLRRARRHDLYVPDKANPAIADVLAGGTAEFARVRVRDFVPTGIQK
jgi:hypothetical protein